MVAHVHHSAIVVHDLDSSLRFYRDGVGLEVLMDHVFDGDWRTLFDAPSNTLRSIFLGDHRNPDAGVVELVVFDGGETAGPGPGSGPGSGPGPGAGPGAADAAPAAGAGFFLLSLYVDVDAVVEKLAALGFGPVRRIDQPSPTGAVAMASLLDPDGVRIELVGVTAGMGVTAGSAAPVAAPAVAGSGSG